MREKTVDHLNEITATHPPLPKPIQWGDAFDKALAKDVGVVIEVHVFRYRKLYENQARWNRERQMVEPWIPVSEERTYFARYLGKDCANYAIGARSLLVATGHVAIWPPAYIAEMLELKVAEPLSAQAASLLMDPK